MGGWRKICFIFTALPFGLTSAPFIFTKVMRRLVKHWRINGIRITCFLDDGLGVLSSYKMKYGENAFTVSWPGKNNYLVPAIKLLPRVIEHIKRNSCKGVLVLPYWLSAAYWPLTATSKTNFLPSVTDYKIFDNPSQCFRLGNNKKSLIGLSNFNGPVLALQFSS